MSDVIGRAGFHAQHTKDVSERHAIIHEMMRELDEDSIAYWAARNPNIVVADEVLNEAMVNDGDGGFRPCSRRQEVLDYGAGRVGRVKRKFREDKLDPKTGKMKGGTVTTSLLVSHLPKSMCAEVPGFYPVLDRSTGDPVLDDEGVPLKRSRWVARDRDEARRYFEDVVAYLADNVIPGGADAILGYDIQHSESTPHVQIVADTFAPDPKNEGGLRVESSQAWFSHRDVRDENGKQKSGPAKLSEYHAGLKEHLLDLGYDISPDFDEERHLVGIGQNEYGQTMDAKRHVDSLGDRAIEDHEKLNDWDASLRDLRDQLADRAEHLDERQHNLETRESELPILRRHVEEMGREDGVKAAAAEIDRIVKQKLAVTLAPARSAAERQRKELEDLLSQAAQDRENYLLALEQLEQYNRTLQPLVEKWEQANPHTERGAKAQRSATLIRQIEQRAAELRENTPTDDAEFGD